MLGNFQTVLGWALAHEGGFVDHPDDPGGRTNFGVTERTFHAWLRTKGRDPEPVEDIQTWQVHEIYQSQYWLPIKGDQLPAGLDYAVFDFAVNSGVSRAARTLQRILGVAEDGVIGNITLGAIADHGDVPGLISALCQARMRFLRALPHWPTFGRGWTRRVMGGVDGAQTDDLGVIDRATLMASGVDDLPAVVAPAQGRGEGEERLAVTVRETLKDRESMTAIAGLLAPLVGFATGTGPVQWAFAGVIVLAALASILLIMRRSRA